MGGCGTPIAHLLLRIRLAVTLVQAPLWGWRRWRVDLSGGWVEGHAPA